MDSITLGTIAAYLVLSTGVGTLMARRSRSARGWTIAGGGLSTAMIAVGVAGTRIGGAGTYGVAGDVVTGGVWNLWWYAINTLLALGIVGMFFAVSYRRLGLQTVGEIFTMRWGRRRCQWLTSLCVQTEYAIVNLIEAYVIGVILSTLTPLSMGAGVVVAAVIFSTYVSLGGLWGTAVTNLIHCSVVVAGLGAVGWLGIEQLGGWPAVQAAVDTHVQETGASPTAWWGFVGAGWLPVIAMFFSAAVHTPAASVYTNYATAARAERQIAPAFVMGGVIAAVMSLLAGLIGVLTTARYGLDAGLGGYRNLTTLATEISPVVGGIALAAVLAAVISSGGPILLSSATMFVRDWLPFTERYSSEGQVRAYRVTTTVYAFVAAGAAWVVATQTDISILDLLLFGFAMVVPPAVAVGFVVYDRRTTERAAYLGMLSGYVGGLVWFAVIKLATAEGEGLDPSYITFFVPLVVIPLLSRLSPAGAGADDVDRAERFYRRLSAAG